MMGFPVWLSRFLHQHELYFVFLFMVYSQGQNRTLKQFFFANEIFALDGVEV